MTPPPSGEPPARSGPGDDDPVPSGWGRPHGDADSDEPAGRSAAAPPRQYFVPADGAAAGPPPRDGGGAHRLPAPPPPGTRPPQPAAPGEEPPPRRGGRRRWSIGRVALVAGLALVVLVLFLLLFALFQFNRMDRVAVGESLSPGGQGTNYLIVGSDSREGFDPDDPNAGAVLGDGTEGSGQRSDTMLVLRTGAGDALMTSIPRDLHVTHADGSQGRINAAYRDGPTSLIRTIEEGVGIPVHHYVEVDFVTFADLVDAVGGVTIEIPHPARDLHSGLHLPDAGSVTVDGTEALAFVRSRHYEELVDGSWVADPTGDLGRVQRQQTFLRSVMSEVGSTRNPIQLMRISSALSGGLRIDDTMGFFDALAFARSMRGLQPESVELPTFPFRTDAGAAVLGLVEPDAAAVIGRFRD